MSRAWLSGLLLLAACSEPAGDAWPGYIEGEYVLLASPYAGQLEKLYVRRGDAVAAGKPVFALEQEAERAARREAEERLKAAQARLDNLQVPRRAPEIAALRAQLGQAQAALELSRARLAREEELFRKGFSAEARLDDARSAFARDRARVNEAEAQLRNARMPLGRDAERSQAQAEVQAAQAQLAQAEWRLAQKSVAAPVSGLVQDTFFVPGEWVPAGRPVASILPPGNVKARFYVPEAALATIRIGQPVEIRCDGCAGPIGARVSFVSTQAEYTPPVLYSKESRGKLRFLVEARLDDPARANLKPGQPIDVSAR
ncbi:MAG TPA: HlyD family efflux transporter periplasmic adaptor subunit [Burkholderiales bacterium]